MKDIYKTVSNKNKSTGKVIGDAKTSICLILFSLLTLNLLAVSFIPVDKGEVEPVDRSTRIFHHNNRVDQLWHGTDRWAVKFSVNDYTTTVDSMTVEQVNIYFPTNIGNFGLKIYTDEQQPLETVVYEQDNIGLEQGWNIVELDESITVTDFWVVIEYTTNSIDRFMAASSISGNYSYYWVPEQGNFPAHFSNMRENNSTAEFLVTVSGLLHFEGADIELISFSFGGDLVPGGTIYPILTIANHSASDISEGVRSNINIENSANEAIIFRSSSITASIPAGDTVTVELDRQTAVLSEIHCQYRGSVIIEHPDDEFMQNNRLNFSFNTFETTMDKNLIENFIKLNHQPSETIVNIQDNLADFSGYKINYFFHPQDEPYFIGESAIRKDFYNLSGYPFTLINGTKSIAGNLSDYETLLLSAVEATGQANTFITLKGDSLKTINASDMQLDFNITLENSSGALFQTTRDNLRLFLLMTEKNIPNFAGNTPIYIYRHLTAPTLGRNQQFDIGISINLQTIDSLHSPLTREYFHNFSIIYWIQDIRTKNIYYINSLELDDFQVTVSKETISPQSEHILVHPNPFTGIGEVTVRMEHLVKQVLTAGDVYNIKGQLIGKMEINNDGQLKWDGIQVSGIQAPNGIYFLKINSQHQDTPLNAKFIKLLIIR